MLQILESLTSGATLLLAFLVWTHPKKANKMANRWLGFFLCCIFLMMLDDLLDFTGMYLRFPHLIGYDTLVTFLVPPGFYLSVLFFVTPARQWRWSDLKHFLLFFVLLLLSLPFLLSPAEIKLSSFQQEQDEGLTNAVVIILLLLFFLQVFLYWVWSYRRLLHHRLHIRLIVSSEEGLDLQWLQYFLLGFLSMLVIWTISVFYETAWMDRIAQFIYFTAVFWLAYYAVRQGEVFAFSQEEKLAIRELIEENDEPATRRRKLLSDEELEILQKKLEYLMQKEKLFLDNELSLPKLAEALETSTHNLSYVLNAGYEENFFQFINRYRIEVAKSMLCNPEQENQNILSIAFASGFNSKTVFNTSFKNFTGLSPSEYRKMHLS